MFPRRKASSEQIFQRTAAVRCPCWVLRLDWVHIWTSLKKKRKKNPGGIRTHWLVLSQNTVLYHFHRARDISPVRYSRCCKRAVCDLNCPPPSDKARICLIIQIPLVNFGYLSSSGGVISFIFVLTQARGCSWASLFTYVCNTAFLLSLCIRLMPRNRKAFRSGLWKSNIVGRVTN